MKRPLDLVPTGGDDRSIWVRVPAGAAMSCVVCPSFQPRKAIVDSRDPIGAELLATTRIPTTWVPGDFTPRWTPAQLRAFGVPWRTIHDWTMTSPVHWDEGERERLLAGEN